MKYKFIFALVYVMAPMFIFAQSRISVLDTVVDWGTVYKGDKVEKMYRIKNSGTDTLRITSVTASCGCTAAMMDKQTLAPDSMGMLSIKFNSENFSGKVHKSVTVVSNEIGRAHV